MLIKQSSSLDRVQSLEDPHHKGWIKSTDWTLIQTYVNYFFNHLTEGLMAKNKNKG
jgi:hypothetical protein